MRRETKVCLVYHPNEVPKEQLFKCLALLYFSLLLSTNSFNTWLNTHLFEGTS